MTPKKSKHCRAAGALVSAVLPICAALVGSWSSAGAEEVIMYRDHAPAPDELADVLFPPAPPPAEKPKMRMRGLRVTGSESTSGSPFGGPATEGAAADQAKPSDFDCLLTATPTTTTTLQLATRLADDHSKRRTFPAIEPAATTSTSEHM